MVFAGLSERLQPDRRRTNHESFSNIYVECSTEKQQIEPMAGFLGFVRMWPTPTAHSIKVIKRNTPTLTGSIGGNKLGSGWLNGVSITQMGQLKLRQCPKSVANRMSLGNCYERMIRLISIHLPAEAEQLVAAPTPSCKLFTRHCRRPLPQPSACLYSPELFKTMCLKRG